MVLQTLRRPRIRKRPIEARVLVLESLEDRRLLTIVNWTGAGGDNSWSDANNWSTNTTPSASDDVTIDAAGSPTITLASGEQSIHSLVSADPISLQGGLLSVQTTAALASGLSISGGILQGGTVTTSVGSNLSVVGSGTLDGVTLDTNLSVPSTTTLTVLDGLTLNGTLTETRSDFYNSTYVNFSGTQTLSGTGSVVFVQSGPRVYYAPTNYFQPTNGGTLTIGAGITIDGQEGVVGNGSLPLINDGSILADQPGQTITVTGSTVTNQGTLGAQNGGVMNIVGSTIVNQGALEAGPGTTLNLNGAWTNAVGSTIAGNGATLDLGSNATPWSNAGTITASASTVNLGGEFTVAGLGTFQPTSSTVVNLTGTLDLLPVAPTQLSTIITGVDFAVLNWSDNVATVSGYQIERSTDGVNFTQIGTVAGNVGTYFDTGLTTGTTYTYRVRAYSALGESAYSNVSSSTPGSLSNGLLTTYYNSTDLSGPAVLTRVEPAVDDAWGYYSSPGFGVNGGSFSGQWLGQLQAQYSETYTFDAQTNYSSAAKVWVNGQLVFNNLDSTPANNQITLVAGQNYDFRVQLQAGYDYPDVHVYWSSPSTPHQVIPASALFMPESGVGILPSNVAGPVVTGTGINTLALDDTTGSWNLAGGDIRGGTVTTSGACRIEYDG